MSLSIQNSPITFIVNKLYQFYDKKEEIVKILACIRRTCRELRDYINNELDKTKYSEPLINTLWRHLDKKSIIYNSFNDYNSYLGKKNINYHNIYLENDNSTNIENNIKLNKFMLNKNIKYTFNIFIVNCIIDRTFCFTSKNEYKHEDIVPPSLSILSLLPDRSFINLFLDNPNIIG